MTAQNLPGAGKIWDKQKERKGRGKERKGMTAQNLPGAGKIWDEQKERKGRGKERKGKGKEEERKEKE